MSAGDLTALRRAYALVCPNICSGSGQGTQGPPGPEGPAGPQGPPGPASGLQNISSGSGSMLVNNPPGTSSIFYSDALQVSTFSTTTSTAVYLNRDLLPYSSLAFTLGSSNLRFRDAFIGPGTLNIAGPVGFPGVATLGSDNQGVAYTEFGFATPFMNVGASQLIPKASGGWQIGASGTQGTDSFDLIAQENKTDGSGLTGPIYSLIKYGSPSSILYNSSGTTVGNSNFLFDGSTIFSKGLQPSTTTNVVYWNSNTGALTYSSITATTPTFGFTSSILYNSSGTTVGNANLLFDGSSIFTKGLQPSTTENILHWNSNTGALTYAPISEIAPTYGVPSSILYNSSGITVGNTDFKYDGSTIYIRRMRRQITPHVVYFNDVNGALTYSSVNTTIPTYGFTSSILYNSSGTTVGSANLLFDGSTIFTKGLQPSTTANILYWNSNTGGLSISSVNTTLMSSITNVNRGYTITVDALYGNDTTASTTPYTNPFLTITAALTAASTLASATNRVIVFVRPGIYNESITIPQWVTVRGASAPTVTIQALNAVTFTNVVTMGANTRLEDVTVNVTSSLTGFTIRGIVFPANTQDTAKVRTTVITMTVSSTQLSCIGIWSTGASSTAYTASDAVRACSITITSASTSSSAIGILVSGGTNRLSVRDVNILVGGSGTQNTGVAINSAGGILQIRSSSISGGAYDITRNNGRLILQATDLVNSTTDGRGFETSVNANSMSFGVVGNIASGTTYLLPGTTNRNDHPTVPFNIRFAQKCVVYQMVFTSLAGLDVGHSTVIHLHKNSIATTQFVSSQITNTVSSVITSNFSQTFSTNESLIVQLNVNSNIGGANPLLATISLY